MIAIVGVGCRLPGAPSKQAFWRLLRDGKDAITQVNGTSGGFVDGIDQFDAAYFKLSAREAAWMDPQQRLVLEVACEALDDAGLLTDRFAGSRTGVFVGSTHCDYVTLIRNEIEVPDPLYLTGTSSSVIANRLSYLFDLRGPSLTIDTACSSSLVALHLARQSLLSGESEQAVVAGVSLMLSPVSTAAFATLGVTSQDGRCKTFDARADGYGRGEGVGVVVLKPFEAALRDGDRIYAALLGSAMNQNGTSNGITAPNGRAQEAVIREALRSGGVSPSQLSYVEAHGTGTLLGDSIEASALGSVLASAPRARPCAIGTVKTNIGHLEAASGIAGVIKLALALSHRTLPASLHFQTPNPHIAFDKLALAVQTRTAPWSSDGPRIGGISCFGFGGTNAHAVLGEVDAASAPSVSESDRAVIVPISASSPRGLEALAWSYLDEIGPGGTLADASLAAIAHTAALRRRHLRFRLAIVARSRADFARQLREFLDGTSTARVAVARSVPRPPPVAVDGIQLANMIGQRLGERDELLRNLAALYVQGYTIAWNAVNPATRSVELPRYPWRHERHWFTEKPDKTTPRAAAIGERLAEHPDVTSALCWDVTARTEHRRVAFVVPRANAHLDAVALRRWLHDSVDSRDLPVSLSVVSELPSDPSAYRAPDPFVDLGQAPSQDHVARRTETEQLLAGIWRELLGVENVGVHENFFTLGGNSLLAIRLLVGIERRLGVRIPLGELFVDATLGGLAARIGKSRASDGAVERPTLEADATRRARLPAALRGVFKLNKLMSSDLFARHVWSAWIDGPLDLGALERAVAAMRARHALLRTRFFADETRETLEVLDTVDVERFALIERADLTSLSAAEQEHADAEFHRNVSFRPLDFDRGEVMSVALSRWSETRHRLTVSLHNIASDAESVTIYVNELCELWSAFADDPEQDPIAVLPPAPLQYHHLADYLERVRESDVGRAHHAFWAARIEGMEALELPIDSPREEVDARREANAGIVAFRSGSVARELPGALVTAIERIAKHQRATVMSTLVAAMAGYLSERTSQRDLAFTTRLSHRYIPGLERTLGFLVNPILLRISTSGSPAFSELVERTHAVVTDAFDHGEYDVFNLAPYSAFRFCLVYIQAAPESALQLPNGNSLTRAPHPGASAGSQIGYDLLLWLHHEKDRVRLYFAYNLELFRDTTATAFLEGYLRYVAAACSSI